MKKAKIGIIFFAGFALGVLATLKLFGIRNIDIPGLPYKNTSIVLKEPLRVTQNKVNLTLPKGTEMVLQYGDFKIGYKAFIPLSFQGDVIINPEDKFSYEKIEREAMPFSIPEKVNTVK